MRRRDKRDEREKAAAGLRLSDGSYFALVERPEGHDNDAP
jgi:hypothetical protein